MEAAIAPDETLTAKGRQTRDRIVAAAAELVTIYGVNSNSLEMVTASASVHKSQLYHYFSSKSELIQAVVDYQCDAVLSLQTPLLANLDTWVAWEKWRKKIIQIQKAKNCVGGCPMGSLVADLAETDEGARRRLVNGFDRWESIILNGLTKMRNQGLIVQDCNVKKLALTTLITIQGGLLLCQARKNILPLENALDAAIGNIRAYSTSR